MSTVLICEDDALLAYDLVHSIRGAGHQVRGVYASSRAVLEADPLPMADMAIIDLRLADGDTGAMLAQTLHKAGVRVIILSGHPNINAGLGTFPYTYAAKPFNDALVQQLVSVQLGCPES